MKVDILLCVYDSARVYIKEPICNVTLPADTYQILGGSNMHRDYNLETMRWIAETDWVFEAEAICPESGILTIRDVTGEADIFLNGEFATSIRSQFVRSELNCAPSSPVQLRFQFTAPVKSVADRKTDQVPERPPESHHGFSGFQYLRRPARDLGWDFAPAKPTVGIGAIDEGPHRGLEVKTQALNESLKAWKLDLKGECLVEGARVLLRLRDTVVFDTVVLTPGRFTWTIEEVELWWPVGTSGQPTLYDLEVQTKILRRIGFRSIKVVRQADAQGRSFQFIVNEKAIFIKGVNAVIEPDAFTLRFLTKKRFNLIRMWGGGDYGNEEFYELADELGLLIWEEFKFACATYPSDEGFLQLVAQEVAQQTQRISNHASIAVFSGNNEVAQSIIQDWYSDKRLRSEVAKNYGKLFIETIKSTFEANNFNHIEFVTSSPSPGGETAERPLPETVNANNEGDAHIYDYASDCWNSSTHPISRFVSEFGFQSIPDPVTLQSAVSSPQLLQGPFLTNAFLGHRQHRGSGNQEIAEGIKRHFDIPDDATVEDMWYLSQVHQGVCMRKMVESFRRQEGNAGAVLWQLNDVWPTISWSIVDYSGLFKYAFYSVGAVSEVSLWIEYNKLLVKSNRPGEIRIIDLSKNDVVSSSFFTDGMTEISLDTLCRGPCYSHIAVVEDDNYILLHYPQTTKPSSTTFTFVVGDSVHVVSDHFLPFVFLRCGRVVFETNGFLLEPFKPKVVKVERGEISANCVSVKSIW